MRKETTLDGEDGEETYDYEDDIVEVLGGNGAPVRRRRHAPQRPLAEQRTSLNFVLTNPALNTLIRVGDGVFVLRRPGVVPDLEDSEAAPAALEEGEAFYDASADMAEALLTRTGEHNPPLIGGGGAAGNGSSSVGAPPPRLGTSLAPTANLSADSRSITSSPGLRMYESRI